MFDPSMLARMIDPAGGIAAKMAPTRDYSATDQYNQHLRQTPKYENFEPSTLRRIGVALAQAATGMRDPKLGAELATQTLDSGYNRAMNDWKTEGAALGQISSGELKRNEIAAQDEQTAAENARREAELRVRTTEMLHRMGIDDRQENRADEVFGFTKNKFGKEFEYDKAKDSRDFKLKSDIFGHNKEFDYAKLEADQASDAARNQVAREVAGIRAGGSGNTTGPSPSQQESALKLAKQQIAMEVPKLMEYYDEDTKQFQLDPRDPEQKKLMQLLLARRDQILRQYKGGSGGRNLEGGRVR